MQEKIAHLSTNTSYGASGATVIIGGFTASEIATLVGVAVALATFAVNWFYRHKMYELEKMKAGNH